MSNRMWKFYSNFIVVKGFYKNSIQGLEAGHLSIPIIYFSTNSDAAWLNSTNFVRKVDRKKFTLVSDTVYILLASTHF